MHPTSSVNAIPRHSSGLAKQSEPEGDRAKRGLAKPAQRSPVKESTIILQEDWTCKRHGLHVAARTSKHARWAASTTSLKRAARRWKVMRCHLLQKVLQALHLRLTSPSCQEQGLATAEHLLQHALWYVQRKRKLKTVFMTCGRMSGCNRAYATTSLYG